MDIRNRIFLELQECKYHDEYVTMYLARSKDWNNWYKMGLVVISVAGAISWPFESTVTFGASILIFLAQSIERAQKYLVPDDRTIQELSNYRMMYVEYFDKLDELWSDLESEEINEKEAKTSYFQLRKTKIDIEKADNSLRIKTFKRLRTKASDKSSAYVKRHYFPNEEIVQERVDDILTSKNEPTG